MATAALICRSTPTPEPEQQVIIDAAAERGHALTYVNRTNASHDFSVYDFIIVGINVGSDVNDAIVDAVAADKPLVWASDDTHGYLTTADGTAQGGRDARLGDVANTDADNNVTTFPSPYNGVLPAGYPLNERIAFTTQGANRRYWTAGYGAGRPYAELYQFDIDGYSGRFSGIAWDKNDAWANTHVSGNRDVLLALITEENHLYYNAAAVDIYGQAMDWVVAGIAASKPTISSYVADPSTIAAGGTATLTVTAAPATPGNTLSYSHVRIAGIAEASLLGATTAQATMTGSSPDTQVTRTYEVTVTEVETGQTAKAQVSVVEQAVVANTPPTATYTVSPQTAVVGELVTFTLTGEDPDGTIVAYRHTPGTGVVLNSTTTSQAVWDTTAAAPGRYSSEGEVQDDDLAWSTPEAALVDLVAAGTAVGHNLEVSQADTLKAGVATARLRLRARAVGGGVLPAGTEVRLDKLGILSKETDGVWRPGGDVNSEA